MHNLASQSDRRDFTEFWEGVANLDGTANDVDAEQLRFGAWDPVRACRFECSFTVRVLHFAVI